MEPAVTSGARIGDRPRPKKNYLNETRGIWSWMTTVDHKRIGIMYLVGTLVAFLLGGIFALLVRLTLLTPQHTMFGMQVTAETYNRFFTLHGAIMVFLFIIPSIPGSLTNFVLPLMLGAKDVAFPRLNLASFYLWIVGAIMAIASMIIGAVDTGWTFYTPYSTTTSGTVTLMTAAVFVLGFSSIFTGLNFIATVHKLRAPGMGWFDMPLFVWGMYSTAVIQVLATPVLGITLVLLMLERVFQIGIFDSRIGGDPVLFQHFFWFYSHPAVYIMILPGMAIISELIPTFSRKTIFGYRAIAFLMLFAIGGLTGIFLGTLSTDIHLTDTYFVVAHFHYVMMGSTVTAFVGGLYYWWPKMTGRMYNEKWGQVTAVLWFIGFNATFLPQFILGSRGMPRRYYNYLDQFQPLHAFSTVGSWIIGLSLFMTAAVLLASLRKPADAPDNPWGGTTMEWQTSSPPITHNFEDTPVLEHEPYDYRPKAVTH